MITKEQRAEIQALTQKAKHVTDGYEFVVAVRDLVPAYEAAIVAAEAERDSLKARLDPAPPGGMLLYLRHESGEGAVHAEPDVTPMTKDESTAYLQAIEDKLK